MRRPRHHAGDQRRPRRLSRPLAQGAEGRQTRDFQRSRTRATRRRFSQQLAAATAAGRRERSSLTPTKNTAARHRAGPPLSFQFFRGAAPAPARGYQPLTTPRHYFPRGLKPFSSSSFAPDSAQRKAQQEPSVSPGLFCGGFFSACPHDPSPDSRASPACSSKAFTASAFCRSRSVNQGLLAALDPLQVRKDFFNIVIRFFVRHIAPNRWASPDL